MDELAKLREQFQKDQKLLEAVNSFGLTKDGRFVDSRELTERQLLEGANVNARDNIGFSPLMLAVLAGKQDVVELLLDHGANPCLHNKRDRRASDLCGDDTVLQHRLLVAEKEWEENQRFAATLKPDAPTPAPR